MTSRLKEGWLRAQESFWFLPAILVVTAIVLSQAAISADRLLELDWSGSPTLALGVEGSRALLTIIGGSVLGVAATAFSITISVIATSSSSYGPRLVRNFMADRGNQFVLGVFVSTFAYCIIVLRSVNSQDTSSGRDAFVPSIAVYLALAIALVNIACLVYFIHHIADSIQITTLITSVRNDLAAVADREYPEGVGHAGRAVPADRLDQSDPTVTEVLAELSGYLTAVDTTALVAIATDCDLVIEMVPKVGDHLIASDVLARLRTCSPEASEADQSAAIRRTVTIKEARTPHQDIRFAIQQLVEMAVRALSPGTNDPYTAQNAIEELGSGMTRVVGGVEAPDGIADDDGGLRVVLRRPRPVELIDLVFDDLRAHGSSEMRVVRAAIQLATRIAGTGSPELAQRAWTHIDLLVEAFAVSGAPDFDVERMRSLATSSRELTA